MGTINFSGVSSGIDWQALIESQIAMRRAAVITPIEEWKADWQAKIDAYDELEPLLVDLQDAAEAMDTVAELRSYQALSSSETKLEASASTASSAGTYSIEINQIADAEVEIHSGVDDDSTIINSSGATRTFAYAFGDTEISLSVADGLTLSDLVALINNDASNPGVAAYILDDGSDSATSHHLVLSGTETGANYTIAINAALTDVAGEWSDLAADASSGASAVTVADTSAFEQYQAIIINDDDSPAEYHIIGSVAGNTLNLQGTLASDFTTAQNAYATPRGMGSGLAEAVSSGETVVTVDDASYFRAGETVIVADGSGYEEAVVSETDTDANTVTFTTVLTNSYGADAYVTQLAGGRKFTFQDTDFTEAQTAQNAQLRIDGYPPTGWIERRTNVTSDILPGVTRTLKDTTDGTPVTVTVGQNSESVKTKIQDFVTAYNAVREFINDATSYNTETEEAAVLLANYGAQFIEQQLRSIIISSPPGFAAGTDTYTLLGEIGIETAGVGEGSDLGILTVDEAALDEALTNDFDAVVRLFADDYAGYSNSSYLTFYEPSDLLTTPGTYDVQADFDASGNLTASRFKLTSETTYRDGEVDSPYVSGASGNAEYGLWVKAVWDGSSTTQSAVVRVTQGIGGQIADLLDTILDPAEGLIHNLDESYGDIINQIDDRIEAEEARLQQLEERLTEKYARLEQLLSDLKGTQDWTGAMADNLPSTQSQ